jgi:hypothetical protein
VIAALNWSQVVLTSIIGSVIGLVILVVLRYALRGARDTIQKEFTSNGGTSTKDKIEDTHQEVQMLRRDFTGLRRELNDHITYDHRRRTSL